MRRDDAARAARERFENAEADVIGCAVVVRERRLHREDTEYAVQALCMAVDMREHRRVEYLEACRSIGIPPSPKAGKETPS